MNYSIFLDTKSKPFLSKFDSLPEFRPRVKDVIKIGNKPTQYKITREEKNSNSIIPPFSFNYFVRRINSSPDSITMGKDIANLTKTLSRLGR